MPELCPRLLVTDCGKPRPGQVVRLHGELKKITDTKSAPIKEYAEGYGSLTDEQADSLIRRWLDSDIAAFEFRRRYLPIFRQVFNRKITATFFQVEHRINAIIDLQLTSQMLWHVPKLYVHRKAEALPAYQRRRWLPCHSARQDYRSGSLLFHFET
jgi:hypothetical protein